MGTEIVASGDADEPGSADGDEGHWIVWDGGGDVRRCPTVYRGPRVWQVANMGVWNGLVLELGGITSASSVQARICSRSRLGRCAIAVCSGLQVCLHKAGGKVIVPGGRVGR